MPLTPVQQASFFRRWHILIRGGLSHFDAMNLMAEQPAISALGTVAKKLRDGKTNEMMALRMEQQGNTFSLLQIAMVKSGEQSGSLVEALELLAKYSEFEVRLRNKAKQWTFTSKLLIAVFVLVVTIVLLNAPDRASIGYLRILTLLLFGACTIGIGIYIARQTKQGKDWLETTALKLPLFENGNRLAATSKFLLGLSMMYKAGCGLTESVEFAGESSGNAYIAKKVRSISSCVQTGAPLFECLARSGALDPETINIIATGETSGNVDVSLNRLAEHYELMANIEIERAYKVFVGAIGSIIAILIGIWILMFYIGQFPFFG